MGGSQALLPTTSSTLCRAPRLLGRMLPLHLHHHRRCTAPRLHARRPWRSCRPQRRSSTATAWTSTHCWPRSRRSRRAASFDDGRAGVGSAGTDLGRRGRQTDRYGVVGTAGTDRRFGAQGRYSERLRAVHAAKYPCGECECKNDRCFMQFGAHLIGQKNEQHATGYELGTEGCQWGKDGRLSKKCKVLMCDSRRRLDFAEAGWVLGGRCLRLRLVCSHKAQRAQRRLLPPPPPLSREPRLPRRRRFCSPLHRAAEHSTATCE